MSALVLSYIIYYSSLYNIDPKLVQALVQVESQGQMNKRGNAGEIGVMQLLPSSFHIPVKKLKDPKINIALGVQYLYQMKNQCPHIKDNTWIICYNLGVNGAKKIKHPKKWIYYIKVMKVYKRIQNEG